MLLAELDRYFRDTMNIDDMAGADTSLNGIQVARQEQNVGTIAFAVDACMETFRRAVDLDAELVFVHHGLFWGKHLAVRGSHYERLKFLLDHDIGLYAVHLPLDLNDECGNNNGIARALGLENLEPFGDYHGVTVGVRGDLSAPRSVDEVIDILGLDRSSAVAVLPFGAREILNVAIVSGGGTSMVDQAVACGADLYITGDASHSVYHTCLEEKLNLVCAGHYQTEVWGVSRLAEKTKEETGVDTHFIDLPTGL